MRVHDGTCVNLGVALATPHQRFLLRSKAINLVNSEALSEVLSYLFKQGKGDQIRSAMQQYYGDVTCHKSPQQAMDYESSNNDCGRIHSGGRSASTIKELMSIHAQTAFDVIYVKFVKYMIYS
eukprot:1058647-Amphidinium_carterae.1